jgi:hypothetical protein
LPEGVTFLAAEEGDGVFLRFVTEKHAPRHVFSLGEWNGIARWTACHRYEPFWMKRAPERLGAMSQLNRSMFWPKRKTVIAFSWCHH